MDIVYQQKEKLWVIKVSQILCVHILSHNINHMVSFLRLINVPVYCDKYICVSEE